MVEVVVAQGESLEGLSLTELEARCEEALAAFQDIERQLSSRDKQNGNGERIGSVEYWQWRRRALTAKDYRAADYRRIKRALVDKRNEERLSRAIDAGDAKPIITSLLDVVTVLLLDSGLQLGVREQATVTAARSYLSSL